MLAGVPPAVVTQSPVPARASTGSETCASVENVPMTVPVHVVLSYTVAVLPTPAVLTTMLAKVAGPLAFRTVLAFVEMLV